MKKTVDSVETLISRASKDDNFRERLLANPKETIEAELAIKLDDDHNIFVHEETEAATHVVLPPRSKYSESERQEAKTGASSLEFLRKTLYDPAPPLRPPAPEQVGAPANIPSPAALVKAATECVRRGLVFLESAIDENGAWHCIRFNTADANIPRHFEKPPFISAFCALALESSKQAQAKALCTATKVYLASTIEYPGLWRYYRHLPQDLDSTTLCSLVIRAHPWILLRRNVAPILANRNEEGCFLTWILDEDEPDVVSTFRIEADPVVNANVIAYLGDRPETRDAQKWLKTLLKKGDLENTSKWYPDPAAICHAITRAVKLARPALNKLHPTLLDHIQGLYGEKAEFGNILQTAQAVSALYDIGSLETIDTKRQVERLISSQREDGSWPELLAFGDQSMKWGTFGNIGHGSESVTTAFCIEALERLVETL